MTRRKLVEEMRLHALKATWSLIRLEIVADETPLPPAMARRIEFAVKIVQDLESELEALLHEA